MIYNQDSCNDKHSNNVYLIGCIKDIVEKIPGYKKFNVTIDYLEKINIEVFVNGEVFESSMIADKLCNTNIQDKLEHDFRVFDTMLIGTKYFINVDIITNLGENQ